MRRQLRLYLPWISNRSSRRATSATSRNVLDPQSRAQLEAYAGQVERTTGVQMALVTLKSLDGEPIEDVSNTLFRQWGVGKKGKDEGIMLLLAVQDHRDRIEVGYGLEPILPDGFDGSILRGIAPLLKQGAYGQAMISGAVQIGSAIDRAKGIAPERRPRVRDRTVTTRGRQGLPWPVIVIGIVVLLFLFRGGGSGGGFLTGMILGNLLGRRRTWRRRLGWRRFWRRRWWRRRLRRFRRRRFGRRRRFRELVIEHRWKTSSRNWWIVSSRPSASACVSVVLYGSAAAGEHNEHFSDINVLCVLTRVTPAELAGSEPIFKWWRALGNPSPLLLSEEELRTSTDCFPIEFHDMQERRRVLFGPDLIRESGDREDLLSRASGDGTARQAAALAPEGRRSPVRTSPRCCA